MDTGPRIDSYEWRGGREAMLRWGPEDGPVVVVALPLFEEANRTRAFAASICRALAGLGVASILPDLPGQGESEVATERMRLADLREAFAAMPGSHAAGIRSGALVVGDDWPAWLLSPQDGAALVRELRRVAGGALDGERIEIAGNLLNRDVLDDLSTASFPRLRQGEAGPRVVRLDGDQRPADLRVAGALLWRRAEPDDDPALAQTLAADIAQWAATCAA